MKDLKDNMGSILNFSVMKLSQKSEVCTIVKHSKWGQLTKQKINDYCLMTLDSNVLFLLFQSRVHFKSLIVPPSLKKKV